MNIGDKVRDRITEFEGVVTGICNYISGCQQVLVAPKSEKGNFKESQWFDSDRCEVIESEVFPSSLVSHPARPGADRQAPKR